MMMMMMIMQILWVKNRLICLKQTRLGKKERYLKRQDNTIYKFSIKLSFSSIGQNKSKLQNQISKLLILTETAA